jgi:hypothetical protein
MSDEMLDFNKVIQAIEFQGKVYSIERLTPDGLLELQRALRVVEKALAQPEPTALEQYKAVGDAEPDTPLERLRFFCSLAMRGQDWLDVEPFFEDLAQPAQFSGTHPTDPDYIQI